MTSIIERPSAWLPVALSLLALAALLSYIALHWPLARQTDEGVAAHLFQIWVVLELAMIAFFAIRWLPKAPRAAFSVLAVQVAAALAACAPVLYLHL